MNIQANVSPQVAIIGGGLLGRLLAWRLTAEGQRVALYDQHPFKTPRSAAHTAAAMISPLSEVVVSERMIYDYGMRSLSLWPEWLAQLNHSVARPVEYHAQGSIVVAHPSDESELHQFYHDLQFHLGSDNSARWLSQSDIHELEPALANQFESGLLLPDEAYLDNRHLLSALLDATQKQGGTCFDNTAIDMQTIKENKDPRFSDTPVIFDCRGMGAKDSGDHIRGVRGEVLWVQTDEVHFEHAIRLMHPRYKLYLVPKPNNSFIIGATEIESSDRSPMSVQSMLELCSALYTLNPAFAEARIVELDTNLRPCYLDNLPAITLNKNSNQQTFISINGLYRHGYLLAPALIEDALAMLASMQTNQ